jgi:predicted dehydrogenase
MRILFVGLGGVGQRHLRIVKELYPDCKLAAVRKRSHSFEINDDLTCNYEVDIAKKYEIEIYESIDAALEFKPDFSVIANPTTMHVPATLELVSNKVPVLMEKPISNDMSGVNELLDLCTSQATPVMVGYMMRFHPCALKLKNLLDKKILGSIYSVVVTVNSYMPYWHKYEKYNQFYAGMKELGGGVVLTEIHELDLLHWMFGAPNKVYAVGGKLSNFDLDVEDTVSMLFELQDNDKVFPANINMSFVQKHPLRNFLVLGQHGAIKWDITNNSLVLSDYENDFHKEYAFPDFARNDMFISQIEHFVECLRTGATPLTSLQNVISGHKTALLVKSAIAS